jgi:hypothetical protein
LKDQNFVTKTQNVEREENISEKINGVIKKSKQQNFKTRP